MEIRKNLIHKPSPGFDCISPSRTVQSFKDECDVNNILRNYVNTGVLTHTNNKQPVFGDFSQIPSDYGEMVNLLKKSQEEFAALPSEVRKRFDNNPVNLVQFLQNKDNKDEAIKLGLIEAPLEMPDVKE